MNGDLEGGGYLFQNSRLVAPVRYRLRWTVDELGRSEAEGELWVRSRSRVAGEASRRFVMHTESGFSLPLEVRSPARNGWLPFRRVPRGEVDDDLG